MYFIFNSKSCLGNLRIIPQSKISLFGNTLSDLQYKDTRTALKSLMVRTRDMVLVRPYQRETQESRAHVQGTRCNS